MTQSTIESGEAAQRQAKRRQVDLGNPEVAAFQVDGTWHVDAVTPLAPFPVRFTDRLVEGAQQHPERTLVARRGPDGAWIRLSYAAVLQRARRIGQALLDRGLSSERPLAILSGNDLEHAVLGLAAMHVGVPYAPEMIARARGDLRAQLDPDGADGAALQTRYPGAVLPAWSALVDLSFRRLDARRLANSTFDLTDAEHPRREFEDAC